LGESFFLRPRRAAPGPHRLSAASAVALPTADIGERRTLEPLRRKPKRLNAAPDLFSIANGTPVVTTSKPERGFGEHGSDLQAGGQGVLVTAQVAVQKQLSDLLEDAPVDPDAATMAQAIARRLSVRRRLRDARAERGTGSITSLPYAYRSDDIDLDKTIEMLAERPIPKDSDVIVRERTSSRRAVVLIVDVSGSMRGEKLRIAAATVAALSADLSGAGDQLALVAFWSDAALLKTLTSPAKSAQLLNTLLRIPARGLTNLGFALSVAHAELSRSAARCRTAIMLTDAVHNAGPDPRVLARRFPALHVLLETDGEHDLPLGRDIASLGHGTLTRIATHRDVAPALNRILNW
jgi:Mg-chelatase subunit ChlD